MACAEIVTRLTSVIRSAQLDCDCRFELDEALARFASLERKRAARQHLLDARERYKQIEAIVPLLGDLDGLKSTERDYDVYMDIALLFEQIADVATKGRDTMRQLYAVVEDGK